MPTATQIWVDEDWQMDVTDESGLVLFVINISALKSAATRVPILDRVVPANE
jgi:hypothetical protein